MVLHHKLLTGTFCSVSVRFIRNSQQHSGACPLTWLNFSLWAHSQNGGVCEDLETRVIRPGTLEHFWTDITALINSHFAVTFGCVFLSRRRKLCPVVFWMCSELTRRSLAQAPIKEAMSVEDRRDRGGEVEVGVAEMWIWKAWESECVQLNLWVLVLQAQAIPRNQDHGTQAWQGACVYAYSQHKAWSDQLYIFACNHWPPWNFPLTLAT